MFQCINLVISFIIMFFFTSVQYDFFYQSLSDNKFSQISKTLLLEPFKKI